MKLLYQEEDLSLEDLAETLNANVKTLSEHTKRLVQAGLLNKTYHGRAVAHSLSPYGRKFIGFIKTFWHSCECQNVFRERKAGVKTSDYFLSSFWNR